MIRDEQEFQQAIEQIERLYCALAALRARAPMNSEQFELLSEGPVDEIRRLQCQLDAYLGVSVVPEQAGDVATHS